MNQNELEQIAHNVARIVTEQVAKEGNFNLENLTNTYVQSYLSAKEHVRGKVQALSPVESEILN